MLRKNPPASQARDGHAERDRRDVQSLIPSVSPFPPVSHISHGYPAKMFSCCATLARQ